MNIGGSIIGGGILMTLLISFWEKLRGFVWVMLGFFVCRYKFSGSFCKYGAIYAWDNLGNKKSLSPLYDNVYRGSGDEAKMFIRETGFNNPRIVFFGKVPTIVTINEGMETTVCGIKPFINREVIMLEALKHYKENYSDSEKENDISRFTTEFVRGSLNNNSQKEKNAKYEGNEECTVPESFMEKYSFSMQEQFDIGRRVNYTAEEYRQYITFTKKDVKLIDNLFLTDNMVCLKEKLERWFNHKEWFMDRSIQWKRGVLIHGDPGTGKTSFVVALAEYFKIPIYIFDIATFTNDDLDRKWNMIKSNTPCFVVFEDFDSVFDGRENVYTRSSTMNKPLSFDCVLNILDGAVKFDGVVTFITTNNLDKIDAALGGGGNTRPGRIDYVYEMNGIGTDGKYFIANKIFDGMTRQKELTNIVMEQKTNTPAQFKELCINIALEEYTKEDNGKTA